MDRICFWLLLFEILWLSASLQAAPPSKVAQQERAQIKYQNPIYMKDMTVFTSRINRNSPYLTNMTGTLMMPYNNNVSVAVVIQLKSGDDFKLTYKLCEAFKIKWILDFIKANSDLSARCPLQPGTYSFYNMELPPKNIPIPIPSGDYYIMLSLFLTESKEKIVTAAVLLHYHNRRRG